MLTFKPGAKGRHVPGFLKMLKSVCVYLPHAEGINNYSCELDPYNGLSNASELPYHGTNQQHCGLSKKVCSERLPYLSFIS